MREVVLDTETTGLNFNKGDRIVEIGAIELINHIPTGNTFHSYLNPPEQPFTVEAGRRKQLHTITDHYIYKKV